MILVTSILLSNKSFAQLEGRMIYFSEKDNSKHAFVFTDEQADGLYFTNDSKCVIPYIQGKNPKAYDKRTDFRAAWRKWEGNSMGLGEVYVITVSKPTGFAEVNQSGYFFYPRLNFMSTLSPDKVARKINEIRQNPEKYGYETRFGR